MEQAAQHEGVTERALRARFPAGHPARVQLPAKRSNGRAVVGLRVDALSAGAQRAYAEARGLPVPTTGGPPARRAAEAPAGVPTTLEGLADLPGMRHVGLGQIPDVFGRNLALVAEAREALEVCGPGERNRVRERIGGKYGVSGRTVARLIRHADRAGPNSLVPGWGQKARGTHPAVPEELRLAILDNALRETQPDLRQLRDRLVIPLCRRLGIARAPSCKTIGRILAEVPPQVRDYARRGARFWETRHAPRIRRVLTDEVLEPGMWLCFDDRTPDHVVVVADGAGEGWAGTGSLPCPLHPEARRKDCCSLRRVVWTCGVELASLAIVALRVSFNGTSDVVSLAVRDAFLAGGLPYGILTDNGWSYARTGRLAGDTIDYSNPEGTRRGIGPLDDRIDVGPLRALGVHTIRAIPYSSWSKPVESAFRAFSRRFENALPGYVGRSPEQKPEKLRREIREGRLLTLDEYLKVLREQVRFYNTERPVGERTRPPAEILAESQRPRVAPECVSFLIQQQHRVTIKQGKLRVGEREYSSDVVAIHSGLQVDVRIDPDDASIAYVRLPSGECVAAPELPPAQMGLWGEPNRAAKRIRRAQRDMIKKVAIDIKGAAPADLVDWTGAHRLVGNRLTQIANEALRRRREQVAAAERVERTGRRIAADASIRRNSLPEPEFRALTPEQLRAWSDALLAGRMRELDDIADVGVRQFVERLAWALRHSTREQLLMWRAAPRVRPLLAELPVLRDRLDPAGAGYALLEDIGVVPVVGLPAADPVVDGSAASSADAVADAPAVANVAPVAPPEPAPVPAADRELLESVVSDLEMMISFHAAGVSTDGALKSVVAGLHARLQDLSGPAAWAALSDRERRLLEEHDLIPPVVRHARRAAALKREGVPA